MNWKMNLFTIFILLIIVIFTKPVVERNDYLNDRGCERGSIELYSELRGADGKNIYLDGDGNPDNNYTSYDDDVNGTVGIRFRWPLQSTCDKDQIRLMQENSRLMQELELLKTCGKYKDLKLGDQFSTVREMCKGVKKKKKKNKDILDEQEP